MVLEYFVKSRKINNFKTGEVETKYFPKLLKKSPATVESLSRKIEIGSTLSRFEVQLALDEWSDIGMDALMQGQKVYLGNFGTLSLKLEAKAQDNLEDVCTKNITRVKCTFYPSKELTRRLQEIPLHKRSYMPKFQE